MAAPSGLTGAHGRAAPPALRIAESALAPLDRARSWLLRRFGPLSRPLLADRELRAAVGLGLSVLVALLCTVFLPFWTLALGPILLGVPHVLADLRYLVVRPGYHRRPALVLAAGLPLAATWFDPGVALGLCAAVGAVAASRGTTRRRLAVGGAAAAAVIGAALVPRLSTWVLVHAHNLVAVGLWLAWRRRVRRLHLLSALAFAVVFAALALGAFDPLVRALGSLAFRPDGFGLPQLVDQTAGLGGPWGPRLLLSFAFAQSVHYALWLRAIPAEDRIRSTPRPFRASLRALAADVGVPVLALAALACVFVAGWAVLDLAEARDGYLRVARCHAVLELAVAALWLVEGKSR